MKRLLKPLIVTVIVTQFFSLAVTAAEQSSEPACSTLTDLQKTTVGTSCRTSKGAKFFRVENNGWGEAWQGPDGLIWSDRVGFDNHYNAMNTCKNLDGTLPAVADFSRNDRNAFREVLPNMKGYRFWSSTVDPYGNAYAENFDGDDGYIGLAGRYSHRDDVRCIRQSPSIINEGNAPLKNPVSGARD